MNEKDIQSSSAPPYEELQQDVITKPPKSSLSMSSPDLTSTQNYKYYFHPPVGPDSTEVTCPQCRCRIRTKVRHRATTRTHLACMLLTCACCCCFLPYCMNSCRNANHYCPMCGILIGTYQS